MAPPAASSKYGSHVGSQDSSQFSDDSGVQALIAARSRESKAAKAAHERAKATHVKAQQITGDYEKKVTGVLEEHKDKVHKKIKDQGKLEKQLLGEMDTLRAEILSLFARNSELLESFVSSSLRETDRVVKDLDANRERLDFFAKEEEKGLNDSIEHWWEYTTEGEGEGEQRED